jgi:hypothetical protein
MNALSHRTPESKMATAGLAGLVVRLEADTCKCSSEYAVIDRNAQLHCRSCERPRGFLSRFRAEWIMAVIGRFGRADNIVIRGPRL